MGRNKLPEYKRKKKITIAISNEAYIYLNAFRNKSEVIDKALQYFIVNHPDYLTKHLTGQTNGKEDK